MVDGNDGMHSVRVQNVVLTNRVLQLEQLLRANERTLLEMRLVLANVLQQWGDTIEQRNRMKGAADGDGHT